MNQLIRIPSDCTPLTHYTAAMVTPGDGVPLSGFLLAINDEDALSQVKSVAKGHAVDVWDGRRFVGHVPAPKPEHA